MDNSRANRRSETREAANERSRRNSFAAYFKVEFGGHASVQGPVKHPKLGVLTLEYRVGRFSSLNLVKIVQIWQKVWGQFILLLPLLKVGRP